MASESIAHSASWAIDSEPIQARGINIHWIKHYLAGKVQGYPRDIHRMEIYQNNGKRCPPFKQQGPVE